MASSIRHRAIARLRQRVEPRAVQIARYLVEGPESMSAGDPRRRVTADPTSFAPVRVLQHDAGGDSLVIGRYCSINHRALIMLGGEHRLDWVSVQNAVQHEDGSFEPLERARVKRGPVTIGSDVYVGYEAMILSGVTIGDGAAISARAWVTRDVAPYEIVAGNPARRVGYRFDEPTRQALLRIRWWDWPEETVRARQDEIHSPDVEAFVRRYDPAPQTAAETPAPGATAADRPQA